MSKVANMLNMIKILQDGKLHKMKDISEEIEVSVRMIKQYKNELEQVGIYIDSKRGIYGGYLLNNELNNIDIGLTNREILKLKEMEEKTKDEFMKKIFIKICNSYEKNIIKNDIKKFNIMVETGKDNLKNIYINIKKAINGKNKVYIQYFSKSGVTKRIIHPAEMFYYLEEWYVAAFCELKDEIRLFKLKDVISYNILEEKYDFFEIKKETDINSSYICDKI